MAVTTNYGWNLPTVGGDINSWGALLNANFTAMDALLVGSAQIKPNLSAGEWQIENVVVTATAAQVNLLSGAVAGTVVNSKAVVYGAAGQLVGTTVNAATTLQIAGVTVVPTAAELNFVDGVTSPIQPQLDAKQPLDADLTALAAIAGAQGDLIYRNATAWTRLPKGTAGQLLRQNAGLTAPEWYTPTPVAGTLLALANFDGTGTPTLRAGSNIAAITDNGAGDYTLNFTTPTPNANYIVLATASSGLTGSVISRTPAAADYTTTSVTILTKVISSGNPTDVPMINVAIFAAP